MMTAGTDCLNETKTAWIRSIYWQKARFLFPNRLHSGRMRRRPEANHV